MTSTSAQAIRSTETYSDTVRRLSLAQKTAARGAPPYSVYVNRRVGRYLAAGAYRLGLTPNNVTAISAGFTFCAIGLLAIGEPSWWLGIVVWLLLATGYAFDSADGQVARLRGGGSPSGEWLDHVVDSIKISTLHLAVLITMFTHFPLTNSAWLLVPIGFTAVAAVSFFAMILNDLLKAKHAEAAPLSTAPRTVVRSLLGLPTDYGVLCLAFVLLGAPLAFLGLYSLLFVANTVYLALALAKWFRDMSSLGRVRVARS
ncbi:CDP-alcohol phosphatidyltransferase family protein [Cryobacterium sp. TMT1-3]|uniref:CDP-alcohol phosphatidyltransferase family protein n=1 Tax=Cryobacterium luteum TaxID=1424661 RepID=A0A1H8BNQ7_9MICO|nr:MULTISPECIES: CDP-alcohol phosphatidyltransferase family protein [Cryobacterium]TFB89077.1 CDP-alcohol phosphatidyltransferase family protein [Cryobacterium luteum]TFC29587.1 CDP-alcohol phosphatidyltransferase family protein [Cryobacterium sp. TMT1-3]SEM84159.1 CDP-alcohol phosphatidyltransferase [Cryobacterium luteum]